MSSTLVIRVKPTVVVMNGIQFLQYGRDYLDAGIAVEKHLKNEGFSPIRYQLLCQSLELHLKAFIWLADRTGMEAMKKKYGHDILRLWKDSKEKNISRYCRPTPLREDAISLHGPYYKKRQFAYFDLAMLFSGVKTLRKQPQALKTVEGMCSRLSEALAPHIFEAAQG